MKKFAITVITTIAAMTFIAAPVSVAMADEGPKATLIKMLAKSQDMNVYQQELAVEVFQQFSSLAKIVKAPKQDVKSYMEGIIERDRIDVYEVMENYKSWQQKVDTQFEQSLIAAAKLHEDLSIEQRKQLVESIRALSSK